MPLHNLNTVSLHQMFLNLEFESCIEGYGQSYDAAPAVLLLLSGNLHPPDSLRDPEGLRTCRPVAGLDFTLN